MQLFGMLEFGYGRFYSVPGAIGIMLSTGKFMQYHYQFMNLDPKTGNVGTSLEIHFDQVNTYLSRDAGLTWSEIKKGSYVYEIGDLGALLVFADITQTTDTLLYTWNEGICCD